MNVFSCQIILLNQKLRTEIVMTREMQIEDGLITKLSDLKYAYRPDIRDRDTLEKNFREKFQALNRVNLTDSEFARLKDEIINPDVFAASRHLREKNTFIREDDTPLHYTLVNLTDWCKNEYEVIMTLQMFSFTPGDIEIPAGSTVEFIMTSKDLVHGFQIAGTNVNAMVTPGYIQTITETFDEPGEYLILCNEYCGTGHQHMSTTITVY